MPTVVMTIGWGETVYFVNRWLLIQHFCDRKYTLIGLSFGIQMYLAHRKECLKD